MEELKKCPFCGKKNLKIYNKTENNSPQIFYVECQNCFTEGPFGLTQKEALESWNKREDKNV